MSTPPKPRDRRPEPPAEPPAEDKRTETQKAHDAAAEATAAARQAQAEALQWRIVYQYGIAEEDLNFFFTSTNEETLTRLALRLGTKQPAQATPTTEDSNTNPGDTAN